MKDFPNKSLTPIEELAIREEEMLKRSDSLPQCASGNIPMGEIVSSYGIVNFMVMEKLNSGGWSDTFRINPNAKPTKKYSRFLKIPFQNTTGSKGEVNHFGSLEDMIKAEEEISSMLFNSSLLLYGNIEPSKRYLPVPQFHSSCIVAYKHKYVRSLIYEFIEGETLKVISSQNKVSKYNLLQIATNAAYALNFVHLNVGTHNDIKSDNFMATKNGRVYILDLAFSNIPGVESSLRGSRVYTAPERFKGGVLPSIYSDMYGFGIVLHELFFKELPFKVSSTSREETEKGKYTSCVTQKVICPNYSMYSSNFYKDISSVIVGCTNYDSSDSLNLKFGRKFNSMQEVENELIRIEKKYRKNGILK